MEQQQFEFEGNPSEELEEGGLEPEALAAVEAVARAKGWVPKEKYNKAPETWVDADTFLKRGENMATNLKKEVDTLRLRLRESEEVSRQFIEFQKEQAVEKERQYNEQIKELTRQLSTANREGDFEIADVLEGKIEALKEVKAKTPVASAVNPSSQQGAALTPEMQALEAETLKDWIEDNPWVKDPNMEVLATAMAKKMREEGETATMRTFLDKVGERMKQTFPRRLSTSGKRQEDATSGGGSSSGSGRSGKSVSANQLSSEDRALMNKFIKQGLTTEQEFLKNFAKSNGGV